MSAKSELNYEMELSPIARIAFYRNMDIKVVCYSFFVCHYTMNPANFNLCCIKLGNVHVNHYHNFDDYIMI